MPGKVVTPNEWLTARKELLAQEKAAMRANDALAAKRRELPIVQVAKEYTFTGPEGPVKFSELFEGRKQLIIYHFMLGPDDEAGCEGCSFMADNLPVHLEHLNHGDTTFIMVSRAPYEKIKAYQKRMGWPFRWYSSEGQTFNFDFHVTQDESIAPVFYNYKTKEEMANNKIDMSKGEQPGLSVFLKDGDDVFHTYSTYARGLDTLLVTHNLLDLTPLGRPGVDMNWKRHDEYDGKKETKACH